MQIARQLCAAIAAAHERGVIHRDLKPANVMIDGEGDVRVTDFGIATATADNAEFVGTPQYMAPEQFSGGAASIKSDIYALGLILFEVFTGRRAQESKTLEDLKRFHQTGTHTTPSSIVHDLDPGVERVILRCLERDPERRPVSALAVAAALPGAIHSRRRSRRERLRPRTCWPRPRVRGAWRRPGTRARDVRDCRAAGVCRQHRSGRR